MDFKGQIASRFVRIVAIISLLVGLADAARLLGVSTGNVSPLQHLGQAGFVYLAIFCLARLFAAVGLWIGASWGAVLLFGATTAELLMFMFGNRDVQLNLFEFAVRLVLVIAIGLLFALSLRLRRAHD